MTYHENSSTLQAGHGNFQKMMQHMQEFKQKWQAQRSAALQREDPAEMPDPPAATCNCCCPCKARNNVSADMRTHEPVQPTSIFSFLSDFDGRLAWLLLAFNLVLMVYGLNTLAKVQAMIGKFNPVVGGLGAPPPF